MLELQREVRRGQDEVQETLRSVLSTSGNVWLDTESMSDTERQEFRYNSMINYDSELPELGIDSIPKLRAHEEENGAHLPKCMVTGISHQVDSGGKATVEVRSAHIWPARARKLTDIRALELLGLKYGDISSYRNSILLLRPLELQFDKQRISFFYNFSTRRFVRISCHRQFPVEYSSEEGSRSWRYFRVAGWVTSAPSKRQVSVSQASCLPLRDGTPHCSAQRLDTASRPPCATRGFKSGLVVQAAVA